MGLNTKYQTTIGYLGKTRYYFEIRPFDTTHYTDPATIQEFPLSAFNDDWDFEESANDDKLGIQSPASVNLKIDITKLPGDLKNYILYPYQEVDLTTFFPYSVPSFVNVPKYRASTVILFKTDNGDDTMLKEDFVINKKYALKPSKTTIHNIYNTTEYKSHIVDVILVDLFRVVHEGMHPIYYTWLAYNDIENNTITTPKQVEHVYDYVYSDHGPVSDFENVQVYSRTNFYDPVVTTIDGYNVQDGDLVLYHPFDASVIEVWQYDLSGNQYVLVKKLVNGSIRPGDSFGILNGTLGGGRALKVVYDEVTDGYTTKSRYILKEIDNNTSLERVIAILDGNFNEMQAYYFPVNSMKDYYEYVFDFIYKMQMRVPQSDTDHKLVIIGSMLEAYTYKRQDYSRKYGSGVFLGSNEIYFCGLVENGGVYTGGFYAENDDSYGIYEYSNMWDFHELLKGQCLWVSYRDDDKGYRMTFDNFTANPGVAKHVLEMPIFSNGGLTIEENDETQRGVIVNINTDNDNKNEFKWIKQGTIFESELSIKKLFHNMPTMALDAEGIIDTKNYPELKSSLTREVYKYNYPAMPFDSQKLVYFATPSSIADSEMCIRVHSDCKINLGFDETNYVYQTPVLPIEDDVVTGLQTMSVLLQKYSCDTNNTAKKLSEYFTKEGRPSLELEIPIEDALKLVMYHQIDLDYTAYLIDGLGPAPLSYNYFVLLSMSYKRNSPNASIKMSGRF